jgi:hypothetical protein
MEMSLKRSLDCLTWGVLMVLLTWPAAAVGQVINLFENQDAMPVETIEGVNQGGNPDGSVQNDGHSSRLDGGLRLPFIRGRATISDCEDVQARIVEARG